MRIARQQQPSGIALIIVMLVIVSLGIVAGGFAYSMKVETTLARNTNYEADLEWIGRSGVEFARYVLGQQLMVPEEPWDSLNQKWAGGPGGTNEVLAQLSLENNDLGPGRFSVQITDTESRFNINSVNEEILLRAFDGIGIEPTDAEVIMDSLLDWRDPDDLPRINGAETSDYLASPNRGYSPYVAKNGPIDVISELLLVRGITPELFWGALSADPFRGALPPAGSRPGGGLASLFTAHSVGRINVNTASAAVLQLIPGLDPALAEGIVAQRAGPDGRDGTEDDSPFITPQDIGVPGMTVPMMAHLQRYLTVRSFTFEVHVRAEVGSYQRHFVALVRRNNQRDIQVLSFYWL